jgi:hypothetical protein
MLVRADALVTLDAVKERVMEKNRTSVSWLEPAMYRICIQGILDDNWSAYCSGMTIEHESDSHQHAVTILTGQLADQSSLMGLLNSLHDIGCPILSVERMKAA